MNQISTEPALAPENPTDDTQPRPAPTRRIPAALARARDFIGMQNLSLLIALAVLVALIDGRAPEFLGPSNLVNIGLAVSLLGLVAVVQTMVILAGGLDISVGSIVGLASVSSALAVAGTENTAYGVVWGLLAGALSGLFNGALITFARVNPVITTLGTFTAFQGVSFIVTNGNTISVDNATFNAIGSGTLLNVPIPIIVTAAVAAVFFILMRYTDIGRNIYAIGGNPIASRLAGLSLDRYQLGIYTVTGLICGLAGIILTARSSAGIPASGSQDLSLESITAVVLGGAALTGGRGTIVGTILGVLLIGTLDNGLILTNVPSFYQMLARGALLIIAVVIQVWQGRAAGFLRGLGR